MKKFETDIIDKTKNDGYNGNEDLAEVQWNFAGALLYSVTVITTIGKKLIHLYEKRPKITPMGIRKWVLKYTVEFTLNILELVCLKNCTDFYVL